MTITNNISINIGHPKFGSAFVKTVNKNIEIAHFEGDKYQLVCHDKNAPLQSVCAVGTIDDIKRVLSVVTSGEKDIECKVNAKV